MSISRRLQRLERAIPPSPRPSVLFVDEDGNVLDDGSAVVKPWIGRPCREVPGPVKVYIGIDPLQLLADWGAGA